ncbi:MAG: hypothetical protein D6702_07360 [Planctomycetota bacterium]|nr:MAG: hypothetical protein D6702_07360 [Planctomycetota bacterium]
MGVTRKHSLLAGFAGLAILAASPLLSQDPAAAKPKESAALKAIAAQSGKYVGAKKCKMCHSKVGNTYGIWEKSKHAQAYKTLQGDEAKAIAKERGIEDPAKAPECLKCHVTAFAHLKDEKKVDKRFDITAGVQCETCHGPGGDHMKARMKAKSKLSADKLPEGLGGEMTLPDEQLCRSCHNEESPSYKEFKFAERLKAIAHLHPLRKEPRVAPPKKEAEAK